MLYIAGKTQVFLGMGLAVSRDGQITVLTEKRHMPFPVLTGTVFGFRPGCALCSFNIKDGYGDIPASSKVLLSASVMTGYGAVVMVGAVS
jgi:hypothetical protein